MKTGMAAGFVPAFEGEQAVAEPASTGASSGGSPAPQTSAASPAASPSGASTGASEPRTYRDEDVQRIVRERLADEQKKWAPYKELGDPNDVRARLERADRYEKAFSGDAPKVSPEEKELRDLLTKQGFVRAEDVGEMRSQLKAIQNANDAARANAGKGIIANLAAERFGTKEAGVLELIEESIASSIQRDPEAFKAWMAGDTSVISSHFEKVTASRLDPFIKSASARYSSGKAKDKAEVPPTMPKGGVHAPASADRKLNKEERHEAAYKRFMELEGQG